MQSSSPQGRLGRVLYLKDLEVPSTMSSDRRIYDRTGDSAYDLLVSCPDEEQRIDLRAVSGVHVSRRRNGAQNALTLRFKKLNRR